MAKARSVRRAGRKRSARSRASTTRAAATSLVVALLVGTAAGVAGCARRASDTRVVAVAASLQDAVRDIAALYRDRTGIDWTVHAAGTGTLVRQVIAGAPLDVLIVASSEDLARLETAGRVDGGGIDLGSNRMTLIAPPSRARPSLPRDPSDALRTALASLGTEERFAIGNPATVPAGRYARDALESAGVWDGIRDRTILAENVRHVIEYVARGEVAAGIVYRTDAERFAERVQPWIELDPRLHAPIRYHAISLAREDGTAAAFVRFLRSSDAREVLRRHGFALDPLPPGGAP